MSEMKLDGLIPDYGDFTPELSSAAPVAAEAEGQPIPGDDLPDAQILAELLAERARYQAQKYGDALRRHAAEEGAGAPPSSPPQDDPAAIGRSSSDEASASPQEAAPAPEEPRRPQVTVGEDGIITIVYDTPGEEVAPEADEPQPPEDISSPEEAQEPEESAPAAEAPRARPRQSAPHAEEDLSFKDRLLRPVVHFLATVMARRQIQRTEAAKWPEPENTEQAPELSPHKAAKFYAAQVRPLRLRTRIALLLCVILAWISFRLPMAGILGRSLPAQAGACVALTLAIAMIALDVFSAGLRQLLDLRPGAEALASFSVFLSCVDGVLVMLGYGSFLPYCAGGALALTAALWGQRLTCTALRRTFATAAGAKTPSVLTAETKPGRESGSLLRTELGGRSIVRRAERPDMTRRAYTVAAPLFMGLSLLFSVFICINGNAGYFLHIFSALLAVSASLSAFFAFPLPYALAARRLRLSGAALLGFAGCEDIDSKRRIVVTDEDLFPPGTIKFTSINIQEGVFIDKVISYTASLLQAAGSGAAAIFQELIDRRGYSPVQVDDYQCHEGGGLSATIDGETVLVGSASYMLLMGIHLPQNLDAKNSICTAIMGELVGVFAMDYIPVTSVQDALVTLLRGKTRAIFAIRDFNITPLMLRQLFRIPTDRFNFPSFRERYRIAGAAAREDSPASAVIARGGMLPMVDAAEAGRRLHSACRIGTLISLAGSLLGMLILFLLFRVGSYETVSAGNILAYMLLWALPVIILSIGQNR